MSITSRALVAAATVAALSLAPMSVASAQSSSSSLGDLGSVSSLSSGSSLGGSSEVLTDPQKVILQTAVEEAVTGWGATIGPKAQAQAEEWAALEAAGEGDAKDLPGLVSDAIGSDAFSVYTKNWKTYGLLQIVDGDDVASTSVGYATAADTILDGLEGLDGLGVNMKKDNFGVSVAADPDEDKYYVVILFNSI
ncbi:hypothetical protein [Corynebacterium alimapuense]|uniref:Uncharacterized protein n=1 Tax=Corynebacterium alimapuense TaxID=1576874 RepID=A0A3M8K7Z1_9CORY|nr:hypothetical protein [Corynebacterium alimapuense]RNE48634.1 hypothetical protein C5L39_09125 [Corynebacterium alimapuense]